MYKIRDWLFISGYPTASSKAKRDDAGITAVLSLHKPIEEEDGLTSQFLYIEDGGSLLTKTIEQGITFIKTRYDADDRLLIACGAGISRSVLFAIVALVEIEDMSMKEAYTLIHAHHPKPMPEHLHWQIVANYYGETNDFWQIWGDLTLKGLE
ncbi:MAG: dual specificity protein phosphatase [Chloroflexota bacterium]